MKTIIVNKDNLVIGFSDAVIDTEVSRPIINEILLASHEAITVDEKSIMLSAKYKIANDALNIARIAHKTAIQAKEDEKHATTPEEKAGFAATYKNRIIASDIKNNEYKIHIAQTQGIVDDHFIPALKLLEEKKNELWKGNSVKYFKPKAGEYVLTDIEYIDLNDLYPIPANKALRFDSGTNIGTIIDDLVGQVYWLDNAGIWERGAIEQIDMALPAGVIRQEDLTEVQQLAISEQFEIERVAGLTLAEKDAEKVQVIANATAQSVALRSQYEIEGQTPAEALASAQAWLALEVEKIEAKYV